jgi:hypothetical protein
MISQKHIELIPCLSGKHLLKTASPYYLQEVKNLVSCPNSLFEELYVTTIYNLAEFCQAMPFSATDFNQSYEFLKRQFNLSIMTLKIRRGLLLPENSDIESIAAEEAQWTYALFSASLLKNMDRLQSDRTVDRFQLQGDYIGEWNPITGSLYKNCFFYTMQFAPKNSTQNADVFMAALTEHIIPEPAKKWLQNNDFLFEQWWEAILNESQVTNPIEAVIKLAGEKSGVIM